MNQFIMELTFSDGWEMKRWIEVYGATEQQFHDYLELKALELPLLSLRMAQ